MQAKDVMTTQVISLGPGHGVGHAAEIMLQHRVSGLPVLGDAAELLGIVTEGDLMRRAELRPFDAWRRPHEAGGEGHDPDEYIKSHAWCVTDVMTRDVVTVDEDTPIEAIAKLIAERDIKRVPVMRDGRVVGIVSRADLLRGIVSGGKDGTAPGDEPIRRAVLTRLHADLGLPLADTGATVRDGVVTLWGTAGSRQEREAARVAAESVRGVASVVNNLRVLADAGSQEEKGAA